MDLVGLWGKQRECMCNRFSGEGYVETGYEKSASDLTLLRIMWCISCTDASLLDGDARRRCWKIYRQTWVSAMHSTMIQLIDRLVVLLVSGFVNNC